MRPLSWRNWREHRGPQSEMEAAIANLTEERKALQATVSQQKNAMDLLEKQLLDLQSTNNEECSAAIRDRDTSMMLQEQQKSVIEELQREVSQLREADNSRLKAKKRPERRVE